MSKDNQGEPDTPLQPVKDEDFINKINCFIGYLEWWAKSKNKYPPDELIDVISESKEWVASLSSPPEPSSDNDGEKEVMIQAFDKVRRLFESRSWIMEGRGSYRYDDDRYKEEVRYLYDEFDALQKDVWKNIKTKTFEYRNKIIADYVKSEPSSKEQEGDQDELWNEVGEILKAKWTLDSFKATLKQKFQLYKKKP